MLYLQYVLQTKCIHYFIQFSKAALLSFSFTKIYGGVEAEHLLHTSSS